MDHSMLVSGTSLILSGTDVQIPAGTCPKDLVAAVGAPANTFAVVVDERVQDLETPLRGAGSVSFITTDDPRTLPILRHSTAHLLATAVRRLRPEAKIGFGPAI